MGGDDDMPEDSQRSTGHDKIEVAPSSDFATNIQMTNLKHMTSGKKLTESPSRFKETKDDFDPADHEFDQEDEDQVAEFPRNENPVMISWHNIEIQANPVPGCCGRMPQKQVTNEDGS